MTVITLLKVSLSPQIGTPKGEIIEEVDMPLWKAKAYFGGIKNQRPVSAILVPKPDSDYGLDNLGNLKKDGRHTYNEFGEIELTEEFDARKNKKVSKTKK